MPPSIRLASLSPDWINGGVGENKGIALEQQVLEAPRGRDPIAQVGAQRRPGSKVESKFVFRKPQRGEIICRRSIANGGRVQRVEIITPFQGCRAGSRVPDPRPALRSDLGCRISPRWGLEQGLNPAYDSNFSRSATVKSFIRLTSDCRIASARERFWPWSSAIFSSTELRQMRR